MNKTEEYLLDAIKTWVWSGYYTPDEVQVMIDDILEPGVDKAFLRACVEDEFMRKARDEALWPDITDCDRLDAAFQALESNGILALQNAEYTLSDGHGEAAEALAAAGPNPFIGYCFFHAQDLERAVNGGG